MLSIEEAHRRALTAVDEAVGWVPPKREAEHIERILAAHIAISTYGLAVLEEMFPDLPAGSATDSVLMSLMSVKKHIRKRIKALS